jgi:hypothetical protein
MSLKTFAFLSALIMMAVAAPCLWAQEPESGLTIFRSMDCYTRERTKQRQCAAWSLEVLPKRRLAWNIAVYRIEMTKEIFSDQKVFEPLARENLVEALNTGNRWARAARKNQVDTEKEIVRIDHDVIVSFVSSQQGAYCAVRIRHLGWMEDQPFYMALPYEDDPKAKPSIAGLIRALKRGDALLRKLISQKQRQDSLFKAPVFKQPPPPPAKKTKPKPGEAPSQ